MPASLSLAVAQPVVTSFDVGGNAVRHAAAIRVARARVVVFPELSLTGYELDAPIVDPSDERLAPIVVACGDVGALALCGAPVDDGTGRASIGTIAVDGHGAFVAYRKMWLGREEAGRFVAGSVPSVVEVDGWRLGLAICKDTGVPEHAAATAALGMDVYVAGVLEHDRDRDEQPARARRIATAHDVWVAVASLAGATGGAYDRTAGRSAIWRPDGSVAAAAGVATGDLAVVSIERLP